MCIVYHEKKCPTYAGQVANRGYHVDISPRFPGFKVIKNLHDNECHKDTDEPLQHQAQRTMHPWQMSPWVTPDAA